MTSFTDSNRIRDDVGSTFSESNHVVNFQKEETIISLIAKLTASLADTMGFL